MIVVVVSIFLGYLVYSDNQKLSDAQNMIKLDIHDSLFDFYGYEGIYEIKDGIKFWKNTKLSLNSENTELYKKIRISNEDPKSAVVFPIFTAMAYDEFGFYD